jgi:hypothetical protein
VGKNSSISGTVGWHISDHEIQSTESTGLQRGNSAFDADENVLGSMGCYRVISDDQ